MSFRRVSAVVVSLIVTSAVVGSLAGALCAVLLGAVNSKSLTALIDPGLLLGGGAYGAVFGAALGPIASLAFMRRVPFGALFLQTGLATVVGGIVGFLMPVAFPVPIGIAAIGFLSAGVRLAWVHRLSVRQPAIPGTQ